MNSKKSELENELKSSVAQNQEREAEMDSLTQDLADLIPVSENLKKENDKAVSFQVAL